MHSEAFEYVGKFATRKKISIVEVGSKNVNYTVRPHFPAADYCGVDAQPGDCVDVVASGVDWQPDALVDMVICCEVFEHTPLWRQIVANAYHMLKPGGRAVFTCAGPGRYVHGVNIDDPDQRGYYGNVSMASLGDAMVEAGFIDVIIDEVPNVSMGGGVDTQATGLRRA